MKEYLTIEEAKDMMLLVCERIIEHEPLLTRIDTVIGDGDHGLGMKRGFSSCIDDLSDVRFDTVNDLFKEIGMSLLKSMGGASGVLFGTLFTGGLVDAAPTGTLTTAFIAAAFAKAFDAMKTRGRSIEGKKTLLDAIGPATRALSASAADNAPLSVSFKRAAKSAYEGCLKTRDMIAGFGRSRKLGEAALGIPDPGAVSTYLIFAAMDEYANGTNAHAFDY